MSRFGLQIFTHEFPRWPLGLLAGALLLASTACRPGPRNSKEPAAPQLRPVQLMLNWFPEAEHGGFYAALVHGYFQEEGLAVEILSGGPNVPVVQNVASNRVPFAIANADQVLLGRQQQAAVVAVMAPIQDSPHCILVPEESGITRLTDLDNLTLAVGSGKPFARYLLSRLPGRNLTVVPYQGNVAAFLRRSDLAQQAYVFSEPFVVRQQGRRARCLMVSEIGFNPYASVLITRDDLLRDEPDLVARMVRASIRGWQTYLQQPDRTNRYIQQQNPEMSEEILSYAAAAITALCLPADFPATRLGQMDPARWQTLTAQLAEIELVRPDLDWQNAFDNRFCQQRQQVPLADRHPPAAP